MDEFVCVRLVRGNDLDLSLFQFDSDLTFAVFMLNADKTIYGRFGTRSDFYESERDISIEGFRKALVGALELHKEYATVRGTLLAKSGPKPRFQQVGDYPWVKKILRGRDTCIHCHMVRAGERNEYWTAGQRMPDKLLFPWPMPQTIGLELDPKEKAKVVKVREGSSSAKAGLRNGDELTHLNGQPLLSIADVQWVLHNADSSEIAADVRRDGKATKLAIALPKGWRAESDISWRVTTWYMRRSVLGRMKLADVPREDRRRLKLNDKSLALRVDRIHQSFPAYKAGVRQRDVVVAIGDIKEQMSETELLAHLVRSKKAGDDVPVTVLRNGKKLTFKLRAE